MAARRLPAAEAERACEGPPAFRYTGTLV